MASLQPLEGDPSTPWGALVEYIKASGGIVHYDDPSTIKPVETIADLFLDTETNNANDRIADGDALVLVLVSGSWCAPCRNFSPILSACSETSEWATSRGGVKVLFCSADYDEDEFQAYFAKMSSKFSALAFGEDEDARDDLMEKLGATSLPTLLVFDPVRRILVEANGVHSVQATGKEGCGALLEEWKERAQNGTEAKIGSGTKVDDNNETATQDEDAKELQFTIPTSCALISQYFKERLLTPNLPEALSSVILKRENADQDDYAQSMLPSLCEFEEGEHWLFRTAAPSIPLSMYGSSLLPVANAIECWDIERNDQGEITRAIVNIENETGRLLCVFRERIVMENLENGTLKVVKTLNLDKAPSVVHGAVRRRWKRESNLIFHALLGTCDRKKGASSNYL